MSQPISKHEPPFYLLTQPLANSSSQSAANFAHPVIEYHFADDPPSRLLPSSNDECVIIIDHADPDSTPVAQSLNHNLAVAGVHVKPAPGATAASPSHEGDLLRNDKMYIIQTLSGATADVPGRESIHELENPQLILAQFKERNEVLTRVLNQPSLGPQPTHPDAAPLKAQ